jgi:alanine racemase
LTALALEKKHFRPTWAEIDEGAFLRNLSVLSRLASVPVIVVLKADGYGHGATLLAKAASEWSARRAAVAPESSAEGVVRAGAPVWGFGVSSVEEGIALRDAGLKERVLILGSLFPFDGFEAALERGLTPTVASPAAAQALGKLAGRRGKPCGVHLKVDTGMGRIGVSPKAAAGAARAVAGEGSLRLEGVYTHLAQADSAEATRAQLALFDEAVAPFRAKGLLRHVANSAAVLAHPEARYDAVRPGLALYGICPSESLRGAAELSPVMTWKTRAVFLKTVKPGTSVSYGATFKVKRPSRLATLPVGYADGYRRGLSNRGFVLVKGRRCPVVGRVTMDQTIVDVTDVPGVDVGEEVVLLGAQGAERVRAEELAGWCDTIPYEIVCGVSARVPRVPSGR